MQSWAFSLCFFNLVALSVTPSPCILLWFLGTIDVRTGEAQDYIRELMDQCWFRGVALGLVSLSLSFWTTQRHAGEKEEKQNGWWDKGKNGNPAKAFEVVDDPSACLSLRLNPFLKCIKCRSVKFGPDSICDALWRHPHHGFPDVVYAREKGLIHRPRRVGPGGAQVDMSFQWGPVKSWQPGPIKPVWGEP